jgi:tRNA pseudouridine55 synthase
MDGILLIDKPSNMTSRGVVNRVSRMLATKHVGHTGTLDPMATGVLVICIGKATKISELITSYDKQYIAQVTLGIGTDTLDIEGNVVEQVDEVKVTKLQVEEVLKDFVGQINQEVPRYSAIKVEGRKLYRYARSNAVIELPTRNVEIYSLSLISPLEEIDGKIKFTIKCHVSKGTYIRSLARDVGLKLGYPACLSYLRRTKQGNFTIDNCNTLADIEKGNYKMLEINDVLSNIKEIVINGELEHKIRNGAMIDNVYQEKMVKFMGSNGELLAIYKINGLDQTKMSSYKMIWH